MSTILPTTRNNPHWLARALEREYCQALEPYVAWLRQPVGWFVVATAASILVGVTVSPLALSMAAGLLSLLMIGLAYPWLAVRLAHCEMVSQVNHRAEDDAHEVQVLIRNGCLWPLWGLIIEGFVVNPTDDQNDEDAQPSADIALGVVPWLSQATYRLSVRPRLRGRYPINCPQLTCAFPFGIWTARRSIENVSPLVVVPKQVKLAGMLEQAGHTSHHSGTGSRAGGQGDFLGLRDYRQGDSIRQIHWAHTARLDSLVVCERSAAEQSPWHIHLSTMNEQPGSLAARENLAWRVRLAASLCTLLHQQSVPFSLSIEDEQSWSAPLQNFSDGNRLQQAIERLTDIPLDGSARSDQALTVPVSKAACTLTIDVDNQRDSHSQACKHNLVRLHLHRATNNWRQAAAGCEAVIDLDQSIATQVNAWLQKLSQSRQAA